MDAKPIILWGRANEADALVRKYHYSRRPPGSVQCVATWHEPGGLLGDSGPAIAACYFSSPPTRWGEPVWELSRLVRRDDVTIPLTYLIGTVCRLIRQQKKQDLLVSFADSTQGHHGGVYQASSWNYHGKRGRAMDGLIIGGKFVPGRTCNAVYGTRSPERMRLRGIDCEPHYDEGKHLYWRALNRDGIAKAKRLGLETNPYPKPDN